MFQIKCKSDYKKFVKLHSQTFLGKLLIDQYQAAISEPSILDSLSGEARIVQRLTEEERMEERQEGLKEGLEQGKLLTAKNMLQEKLPVDLISKVTGLSIDEIKKIS